MRIVFYTDTQLSGQTPRHRVDDYQQALVDKLEEIYSTAERKGADFLICGGDLFNSPRIHSFPFLNAVMDVLCSSSLKTYLVVGQHDIVGYNAKTFKTSALAFVVNRCASLDVVWEPTKIGAVTLYPSHVWEDPMDAHDYEFDKDSFNILIAHHLLTNKKAMFDVVNTGEFARQMIEHDAAYNLVLSGDLHDGYAVHEEENIWFCNPGSIARQAVSDIHRMPKYAVIDTGTPPVIDVLTVECANPGEDVFGESAADVLRKGKEFDPTAFIKGIEDFEAESADVHELIQRAGRAEGVSREIMEYLASKSEKSS